MRSSRRWLAAGALAWAGAALPVVLPYAEWLAAALFLGWLAFLAGSLSRNGRRRALASIVALVLPLQGAATASAAAGGPAHFHGAHGHAHVERHFHAAGTDSIQTDPDHDRASEQAAQGKSASFGIDAAAATIASPALDLAPAPVRDRAAAPSPGHRPGTPERPPSIAA